MKTLKDVRFDGSHSISLSKLVGKELSDIKGYLTGEFGGEPCFKMTHVVLKDGTEFWCEGEHDCPYLAEHTAKFELEQLEIIWEEQNQK